MLVKGKPRSALFFLFYYFYRCIPILSFYNCNGIMADRYIDNDIAR